MRKEAIETIYLQIAAHKAFFLVAVQWFEFKKIERYWKNCDMNLKWWTSGYNCICSNQIDGNGNNWRGWQYSNKIIQFENNVNRKLAKQFFPSSPSPSPSHSLPPSLSLSFSHCLFYAGPHTENTTTDSYILFVRKCWCCLKIELEEQILSFWSTTFNCHILILLRYHYVFFIITGQRMLDLLP